MSDTAWRVAEDCTRASDEEQITFPEVVGQLSAAGVERYRADLVRAEKVYYRADGSSHVVPCRPLDVAPAAAFSAAGVDAAVRAVQAGRTKYHAFCAALATAGCVDYLVSMNGRRAVYYGRTGEAHVELFPA